MFNSQCSILIRAEGGRVLSCTGRTTRNPTSPSAENCALGIEHWSDPGSNTERWILPSYFCARPKLGGELADRNFRLILNSSRSGDLKLPISGPPNGYG